MQAEREALLRHTWPELRRFCRERWVEFVEVDLRWGIAEAEVARRQTLKVCLDEVGACRPFFIGLLGERYGWLPDEQTFGPDLEEEHPWLLTARGCSVTDLEMQHGVLNHAHEGLSVLLYFRDPAYAAQRGATFAAESPECAAQQATLKQKLRVASELHAIPLLEGYSDPDELAARVLDDLRRAIDAQFPLASIPDAVEREAQAHEAFAATRRRTYIARPRDFEVLDRHARAEGGPLVVTGNAGMGKSALLANWLRIWHLEHPHDFVFQHYIGGALDSATHWRVMSRLITEIRRWTGAAEALPSSHDELLAALPVWIAQATNKARRDGVRCIVVLDAVNQLDDRDHARRLAWLPRHVLGGPFRVFASSVPTQLISDVLERNGWNRHTIEPLNVEEREQLIAGYLLRFGKRLDPRRVRRLASANAAVNPLYLKIVLDELRVTGTHEQLDVRLDDYLEAPSVPELLARVLERYVRDYEDDRPGLVGDALGAIWAARRGLTEPELLRVLRPPHLPRLPAAQWAPLRAALEEGLVDRGGVLDFAHEFLRAAVELYCVRDEQRLQRLRRGLCDNFASEPATERSSDELPWLFWKTGDRERLTTCLLDLEHYLNLMVADADELLRYWVWLGGERRMGTGYLMAFQAWVGSAQRDPWWVASVANALGSFLSGAELHAEAGILFRTAIQIDEQRVGPDHFDVARDLYNLATLHSSKGDWADAETVLRRAIGIFELQLGHEHPNVAMALGKLGSVLHRQDRFADAEAALRRALQIQECAQGPDHERVAGTLHNLAWLLQQTNRLDEAEAALRRALDIRERRLGAEHLDLAGSLNDLALVLQATDRFPQAEALYRRTLALTEYHLGDSHPKVGVALSNLGELLRNANRLVEAEPLLRRALKIFEAIFGGEHESVSVAVTRLAHLLQETRRWAEAEPLLRRALSIDEQRFGPHHTDVAIGVANLAMALFELQRLEEAEALCRRGLNIERAARGPDRPNVASALASLALVLKARNRAAEAEPMLREALAIDEQAFGASHSKVSVRLNNLALLLLEDNRLGEAEALLLRALAIDEAVRGPDHPCIATALANLASLHCETGAFDQAEPLLRRALAIDEQSFGAEHPQIAMRLNNLGTLLQEMGRVEQAELALCKALAILEKNYGADHPNLATTITNLGSVRYHTNRLAEAEQLMRRALVLEEASLGPDHPNVARCLGNLGLLLQQTRCFAEAEALQRRALSIEERSRGVDHPNVAISLANLAGVLRLSGRCQEALPLSVRQLQIFLSCSRAAGRFHPLLTTAANNHLDVLRDGGETDARSVELTRALAAEYGIDLGRTGPAQ